MGKRRTKNSYLRMSLNILKSKLFPRTATGRYRVSKVAMETLHTLLSRNSAQEGKPRGSLCPSIVQLHLPHAGRSGSPSPRWEHTVLGRAAGLLRVVIKCTLIMLGWVTRTTWNNTLPTHWENQVCHTPLCHGFKNISTDGPSLRLGWRGV